jgi:hypothetical protein
VNNNDDHVFEDMDLELDPVLDSDFPALPYYGEWRQNYSYLNYEGHFSDFTAKGSLTIDTTWLSPGADSFDIVIDGNADFQANIRIDGNLPVNFYIKGDLTIEQSHFRVTGPEQLRFFVQSGDVRIARLDELKMYLYAPNSEVTISPRTNNGNGSKTIVEGAIVAKTLDIESTMRMRYVYSDLLGTMAPGITAPPGGVFSVDNWE